MAGEEQNEIAEAKRFLRGEDKSPEAALALAKALKGRKEFHLAWQILARARRDPAARAVPGQPDLPLRLGQLQALCTYKDPDLPTESRLTRAFELLKEIDDPSRSVDQETLGLAGAIHKYRWQWDGQRENLELAKDYYLSGYQKSYFVTGAAPSNNYDKGWTGINAAFVLDLLASLDEEEARKANVTSKSAQERRNQAAQIRNDILNFLPDFPKLVNEEELYSDYWFLATLAEANFGLNQKEKDDKAIELLQAGKSSRRRWSL